MVEERSDCPLRAVEIGGTYALRVAGGFAGMARALDQSYRTWLGVLARPFAV